MKKIKIMPGRDLKLTTGFPKSFYATAGDRKGEVDLQWDPLREARLYIVQVSVYSHHLNWIKFDIISRSNYTVSGLKSSGRYCFRVCAVSALGKGPWSKSICKLVP